MLNPVPKSDRPRRSALYMPASNPRALEKAKSLTADVLIFDLEDAVAPDAKDEARRAAVETVGSSAYGHREILIRVNGLDTSWGPDDMNAVAGSGADGVLVPKVSTADDLRLVDTSLNTAGADDDFPVWAMMETAKGILAANEIGQASNRLTGFCVGTADLAKDLQCAHPSDRGSMLTALQTVVLAARANGLLVLDGVHVDLNDDEGFLVSCRQGRDMGFDGKTLIHPKQIEGANQIFAPSDDDVAYARRLIAAHEEAAAQGAGVTTLDGRLVESLHVAEAQRLIAKAETIAALDHQDVA